MKKANERGTFCPLLKKDCIENKCLFYIWVRGTNPNTQEPLDHWDCAIAWLPTLLINTANETRQGAAAVESFRNEVVRHQDKFMEIVEQRKPRQQLIVEVED